MTKKSDLVAIIDVGSSSIRLVIFDEPRFSANIIFNEKVTLELGTEISEKLIKDDKIKSLLGVLRKFFKISRSVKKNNLHIFASAALRIAKNSNLIVELVRTEFDHEIKILTAEEEGVYSAMGVFFSHSKVNGIVGDFGGGSLEITSVNESKKISFLESLTIGHVVLRKMGNFNDKKVRKYIFSSIQKIKKVDSKIFYAVGGSFRALAKLHILLKKEDLKIIQDYEVDAQDFIRDLKDAFFNDCNVNFKLISKASKSRMFIIPYAFYVLENLIQKFNIKKIFFTNTGIREGFLYSLINKRQADPFLSQIRKIANRAIKKKDVLKLFDWIEPVNYYLKIDKRLLLSACWLTNIANSVHPEHRRVFALESVLYYPFYHLKRYDRYLLSLILYFRYSKNLKGELAMSVSTRISYQELLKAKICGQLLRIAHHITGRLDYNNLKSIQLKLDSKNNIIFPEPQKHYLLFGQSYERGVKNIKEVLKTLHSY